MQKLGTWFTLGLLGVLVWGVPPRASAQDKTKSSETLKAAENAKPVIPLKVMLVLSEFDGEKKISSLPYGLFVSTADRSTRVRSGMRVPVATGSFGTGATAGNAGTISPLVNTQLTYLDVGTNIDCSAQAEDDGRYKLMITIDRSSIAGEPSSVGNLGNPIIRQFRSDFALSLKDGQTIESVMATDPLTGHVLRVGVTLNVAK